MVFINENALTFLQYIADYMVTQTKVDDDELPFYSGDFR